MADNGIRGNRLRLEVPTSWAVGFGLVLAMLMVASSIVEAPVIKASLTFLAASLSFQFWAVASIRGKQIIFKDERYEGDENDSEEDSFSKTSKTSSPSVPQPKLAQASKVEEEPKKSKMAPVPGPPKVSPPPKEQASRPKPKPMPKPGSRPTPAAMPRKKISE